MVMSKGREGTFGAGHEFCFWSGGLANAGMTIPADRAARQPYDTRRACLPHVFLRYRRRIVD
jgi:hypothetical protein